MWQNFCQNHLGYPNCLKKFISEGANDWYLTQIHPDLDAQSDFDKNFIEDRDRDAADMKIPVECYYIY